MDKTTLKDKVFLGK